MLQLTMSSSLNFKTGLVCMYIFFHFLTIIGLLNIEQRTIQFKLVYLHFILKFIEIELHVHTCQLYGYNLSNYPLLSPTSFIPITFEAGINKDEKGLVVLQYWTIFHAAFQ